MQTERMLNAVGRTVHADKEEKRKKKNVVQEDLIFNIAMEITLCTGPVTKHMSIDNPDCNWTE